MAATKTYYNFLSTCYFVVDAVQQAAVESNGDLGRYDEDASFHIFDSTGVIKHTIYNLPSTALSNAVTAGYLSVASSVPAALSTAPATGWVAPTGLTSHATFDPSTVTLSVLGETVAQMIKDLMAQGILK